MKGIWLYAILEDMLLNTIMFTIYVKSIKINWPLFTKLIN